MTTLDSTRYNFGLVEYVHRGKTVTSTVGNSTFDKLTKNAIRLYQMDEGYIPTEFANRPDNISDLFYNSPGYWWLIMLVNNVPDPFEGLNPNDRILLPKI